MRIATERVGMMNEGQFVAIDSIDRRNQQLDTGAQVDRHLERTRFLPPLKRWALSLL